MADRQTALAVFDFLDSLRAGQYRIGADAEKDHATAGLLASLSGDTGLRDAVCAKLISPGMERARFLMVAEHDPRAIPLFASGQVKPWYQADYNVREIANSEFHQDIPALLWRLSNTIPDSARREGMLEAAAYMSFMQGDPEAAFTGHLGRLAAVSPGDLDPARARDVSGQFGARMRRSETYYPNLAAFVERFVANVFCYHQSASVNMQWVSDWWRYPALVFPLDAMWRAYENARKAPGQMMIFYIQAASMLDRVFDKDRGIVASLDCKQNLTRKGEPLPCERPNRAWREPILETLSVPAAGGKENKETTITPTRRRNNGSN